MSCSRRFLGSSSSTPPPVNEARPARSLLVERWRDAQDAGLIRADLDAVDVTRLALAVVRGWLQFHEYIAASTRVADGDGLDEIAGALITVLAPPR